MSSVNYVLVAKHIKRETRLLTLIMFLNMTMTTTIMRVDVAIFASLGPRHHDVIDLAYDTAKHTEDLYYC